MKLSTDCIENPIVLKIKSETMPLSTCPIELQVNYHKLLLLLVIDETEVCDFSRDVLTVI